MPLHITVRCTEQEHALITAKAKSHGMSTSEYVRFVSLNAVVEIKAKEGANEIHKPTR